MNMYNHIYAVLIDRKHDLDTVKNHLCIKYPSLDYMKGFLDSYLFDEGYYMTLAEYSAKVQNYSPMLENKNVIFVGVGGDITDD